VSVASSLTLALKEAKPYISWNTYTSR